MPDLKTDIDQDAQRAKQAALSAVDAQEGRILRWLERHPWAVAGLLALPAAILALLIVALVKLT